MKTAQIKSTIWKDPWFSELPDSDYRLLFIHLISCEECNAIGIYQTTTKIMSNETAIKQEKIKQILNRFCNDEKVLFLEPYIVILNRIKYNSDNAKLVKNYHNILDETPKNVINAITATKSRLSTFIKKSYRVSQAKKDRVSHTENDTLSQAGNDTQSHLNLIKSNLYQSNLSQSNPGSEKPNPTDGLTDSELREYEEVKKSVDLILESYKVNPADMEIVQDIMLKPEGRAEIKRILKKVNYDDNITEKGRYFVRSLINNFTNPTLKETFDGLANKMRIK